MIAHGAWLVALESLADPDRVPTAVGGVLGVREAPGRSWQEVLVPYLRDRQILLRFYIAEEDKDRIAADYGLSSLQLNRVLHRARQRYKELLTRRMGGDRMAQVAGAILLLLITLWWREHLGGGA